MVCAAYAANVLDNALTTLGHEARERAIAQVDELLIEYSQWPFAKRAAGVGEVGANLAQEVNKEINESKDKELQLEVCLNLTQLKESSANNEQGCCRLPLCFHPVRLSPLDWLFCGHSSVPHTAKFDEAASKSWSEERGLGRCSLRMC